MKIHACFCLLALVLVVQQAFAFDAEECRSHYEAQAYDEALNSCRSGAIRGEAESKYHLGMMYFNGSGIDADRNIAFTLIEDAAYRGYAKAMAQLASIYWNGGAREKNLVRACDWWERAADIGYPEGMEKLGVCFMLGKGREKDIAVAYQHLKLASDKGSASAEYIVNRYKALFPSEEQSLSTSR